MSRHLGVLVTPVHSLVAIAGNGWSRSIGMPGRNQLELVGRNQSVRAPRIGQDHASGFDRLPGVMILDLCRAQVA